MYFKPLPLEIGFMLSTSAEKSFQKALENDFGLDLKNFYCRPLLPQGKLMEVPISIKFFTTKVVGQTILAA